MKIPTFCFSLALAGVPLAAAADGGASRSQQTTEGAERLTEVYFAFDSSALRDPATHKLRQVAEQLEDVDARIVLSGHTDPRGTGAYNAALSARRAEAVQAKLVALGVNPDQIVLSLYGEDGAGRATYALERRVTLSVTDDPLYAVIDRAFPEAIAVIWGEPVPATALVPPTDAPTDQVAER